MPLFAILLSRMTIFARGFGNEGACHAEGANPLLMEVCGVLDNWLAYYAVSAGRFGMRRRPFSA
jgi:hypothetical protein